MDGTTGLVIMYVIRFTRGSRRRYATATRGDPEYNAIDTANLEDAKTWKTKRGADNYLKSKVLIGRSGQRTQKRWDVIEVVEVDVQPSFKVGQVSEGFFMNNIESYEDVKKELLLETEELEKALDRIFCDLINGRQLQPQTIDASKVNNLIKKLSNWRFCSS